MEEYKWLYWTDSGKVKISKYMTKEEAYEKYGTAACLEKTKRIRNDS